MIALTKEISAPQMDPFALGEIDAALRLRFLPDRRDQHVFAQKILKLLAPGYRCRGSP